MPAGRILRPGQLAVLLTAAALLAPSLPACAQLLQRRLRTESGFLESPPGVIKFEFAHISPRADLPRFPAVEPHGTTIYRQSADVDVNELCEVLEGDGVDEATLALLVTSYAAARKQIADYAEANAPFLYARKPASPPTGSPPKGIPAEFSLYLEGALAYANGDDDAARRAWLKLLELPARQRRHRSVWAAYMLGRCPPESATDDWSVDWYRRCRAFAADGFTDKLGLAAASYGWEAKVHFDAGQDAYAIDLYLTQAACGDGGAVDSLAIVAEALFAAGGARLDAVAESPPAVAVLCAFVGAGGGPFRYPPKADAVLPWLGTLSASRDDLRPFASQIAWAAYAAGDFALSERWLALAGEKDPRAHWLRAGLLVRAGKLQPAVDALRNAAAAYDPAPAWDFVGHATPVPPARQCRAEAGVVLLAMGKYEEALKAFSEAQYRDGIEYVAERVLTADELCAFDKSWAVLSGKRELINALCMRRLVRLGRWDEARAIALRDTGLIDAYRSALRRGDDTDAYAEDRATALWEAAGIAHDHGRQLFRRASSDNAHWRDDENWTHLRRSADEAARFTAAERQEIKPDYPTYVATDLAWRAAELLPDEDDQTARILNRAGRWYGSGDSHLADRFYKALVRRCGTTSLGRAADRRGWFIY